MDDDNYLDDYDDGMEDIVSDYSGDFPGVFDEDEDQEEEDTTVENVEQQITHQPVKVSIIEGDDRRTLPVMTKYEYTFAIAYRAEQIENGILPHSEVVKLSHLTHSLDIAKYELDHFHSTFPNYILRPILDSPKRKIYEKWYIPELVIPRDLLCISHNPSIILNGNCKNERRIEFEDKARSFAMLKHFT